MATDTTIRVGVSPTNGIRKRINKKHDEGIATGMYLTAPTRELAWYTVPATRASYLVDATDIPSPSAKMNSATRPEQAELVVIMKVFRASLSMTSVVLKHLRDH